MIAGLLADDPTTAPALLDALVERAQTSRRDHLTGRLLANRALSPEQRDLLMASERPHWRMGSLLTITTSNLPRAEVLRLIRSNSWDEYDLFAALKDLPPSAPSTVRAELLRQLARALKATGRAVVLESGFLLTQPNVPAALLRRAMRAQASSRPTPTGKLRLAFALATHPRYRTSTLRAARVRGDLTKEDSQDLLDLSTLPWHTTPHEQRDEHWMQMLALSGTRTSRAELIEATADPHLIRATLKHHPTPEEASAVLSHKHLPHDLLRPAATLARYATRQASNRVEVHSTTADLISTSLPFANTYLQTASRAADAQYAWHAPELPEQTIAALAAMLELKGSEAGASLNAWLAIQVNTPFTVRRRALERAGNERWVPYVQAGAPRMPAAQGGAHVPVSMLRATQLRRAQWQAMWRAAGAHLASRSGELAARPRALSIAEALLETFTGTLGELVTTALAIAGPSEE